ncbi:hypothetical protein [Luteolibacter soli]|uniref:DUF3592 domain-containing protein n=1 Tax=Luteolibacter soli TaxID=3135280 RepID=A0ABU9AXM1_9BACT
MRSESEVVLRRPLYRWKSFWLGVLVLFFIDWAWVRSMTRLDMLIWTSGARDEAITLRCQEARVMVEVTGRRSAGSLPYASGFMRATFPYDLHKVWFERPAVVVTPFDSGGGRNVSVAYWVVGLGFLVSWVGFLVGWGWWMRRRGRKTGDL